MARPPPKSPISPYSPQMSSGLIANRGVIRSPTSNSPQSYTGANMHGNPVAHVITMSSQMPQYLPSNRGVISSQTGHHPGMAHNNIAASMLTHEMAANKNMHSQPINTSQPLSHGPGGSILNGGHAAMMSGSIHNHPLEGNSEMDRKSPGSKALRLKAKEHSLPMGMVRNFRC